LLLILVKANGQMPKIKAQKYYKRSTTCHTEVDEETGGVAGGGGKGTRGSERGRKWLSTSIRFVRNGSKMFVYSKK
jgi:hypothetical protein